MHHWLANSPDYCEKQNVLTQQLITLPLTWYSWPLTLDCGDSTAWSDVMMR